MQPRNRTLAGKFDAFVKAFAGLVLLLFAVGAGAQSAQPGFEQRLAGELVAETRTPAPGETVMLAFRMTPDPGWHGYWENPGDAGVGMEAKWELPKGVSVGALQYPVPTTLLVSGLMNHVYKREYAVLVPLQVPADMVRGTKLAVRVNASALVCDDKLCIPQDFELATELTVGDGTMAAPDRARFDGWRAKLPQGLGSAAHYVRERGLVRIAVPLPATVTLTQPHLFVKINDVADYAAPQQFFRKGDLLIVELKEASPFPGAETSSRPPVPMLLRIAPDRGLTFVAQPGKAADIPTDGIAVAGSADESQGFDARLLLVALTGAVLGGLILNIMPCVFPILSLKAISLARAGGEARQVRREAWAYTAGVVLVCLALGGVILGLKAAGQQVGWAFQLQNPVIVFLLLILVSAITANLVGWFEITGPSFSHKSAASDGGVRGAFLTGVLAAIVATPCTGPFMGAALGATLVLPGWAALVIFGGLGLGLALPFLAIAYSSGLRAMLPKPGPWMERFRRWMAGPMGLTMIALLWLLWGMASPVAFGIAILCTVLMLLLLWMRGRRKAPLFLSVIVLLAIMGSAAIHYLPTKKSPSAELTSEAFSGAALEKLRAARRPVFVYFTADWCVTCKVNEAAAINRANTQAAFKAGNVAVLKADWTTGDPAITRTLAGHGRNSVPLYLWYKPGASEPEILPQILTPAMLTESAKAQ